MKKTYLLLLTTALFISACSKKSDSGTTPIVTNQGGASSVSTFAGTGVPGAVDGTKTQASFDYPTGLAISPSGILFVADAQNNAIRYLSPQVVTTIAGTGTAGFSDTTGSVTFSNPTGTAVDPGGNVYVADQGNSAIRVITTAGVTTVFAGTGSPGFANGPGILATFVNPTGVAADAEGNIYVADNGNNAIRKITSKGIVTTLAGTGNRGSNNGAAATATFNQPYSLAVDASDNVYVADTYNNMIRKITPQGVVSTFAGSGTAGSANGVGTAASFNEPQGIAVDANGNVYVGDTKNNMIREITPSGTVTTIAGTGTAGGTNGTLAASTFNAPEGLAVDSYGRIFVADTGNSEIRMITIN